MVIVASDRISAFDVIFKEKLTGKGQVLTRISNHWFELIQEAAKVWQKGKVNNHLLATDSINFPEEFKPFAGQWQGRAVWVRKLKRIDFECVVRGFLIGSGWKEYQKSNAVCGIALPSGLKMAQKLPEPIFTPATKSDSGHDENVSIEVMAKAIGKELAQNLKEISLGIYEFAARKMLSQGIILADTKFEFGLDTSGEIFLIDEVLTPDSSRFWDIHEYREGFSPPSYDKQILRDYLETTSWDKTPPPPAIPQDIIDKTMQKYREIEGKIQQIKAE
jgi:phosphoribosylaminoimidazole-succinocarboxamide synthase